jgi:hypothetical protein
MTRSVPVPVRPSRRERKKREARRRIYEAAVREATGLIESAFFRTLARWLTAGGSRRRLHREISARLEIVLHGLVARRGVRVAHVAARARHERGW